MRRQPLAYGETARIVEPGNLEIHTIATLGLQSTA
jgi:hypothetical protein